MKLVLLNRQKLSTSVVFLLLLSACQSPNLNGVAAPKIGEQFLPEDITEVKPLSSEPKNEQSQGDETKSSDSGTRIIGGRDLKLAPLSSRESREKKSWTKKGGSIALNFSNISIEDAAQLIIGDQLAKPYSIDANVSGLVSLNGQGGLHQDDLIPAFNVLLSSVDAKVVSDGEGYRIVKGADAKHLHSTSNLDLIPLKYVSASDFAAVLSSHGVSATVVEESNMVAISARTAKLRSVRRLAQTFDVNWFNGQSIGVFPVENGRAGDLKSELLEAFAKAEDVQIGSVKIVEVQRTNSLMVVAPSALAVKQIGDWVNELDRQSNDIGSGFYVYRAKNGKASDLAKLANEMFGGVGRVNPDEASALSRPLGRPQAGEGPGAPALRILADDATNSVIVSGSPYHFKLVKAAMKQLDTKPLQVLVEARIMELTLSGELQYGLEWFLRGSRASSDTTGSLDFNQSGPNLSVPGFNYVIERADDIRGVLNAFADDSRLKVLSSPSLLVLNNSVARIQVGDEVPIPQVQSVSNFAPEAPTVNSITYRDTGIVLEIVPRINQGGMVTLDVTQEVSSVGQNTVSDIDAPVIQQRKLSSTIAVQNGQTVVLGGLIQERALTSDAGVPVLKNLPGVGKLFSSTGETTSRTELVALLTPKVIEREEDFAKINQDYLESFQGLQEIYVGK